MSKQVRLRRGTALEHETFTGANAELTVDTTHSTLRLHDGVTTGGKVIGGQANTITDLRNFQPTVGGQSVEVLGHTIAGIGGGQFYYDPDDTTSADNNGTVIVTGGGHRWKRKLDGHVTPEMFGALGDGVADDSLAVESASSYSPTEGLNHYRVTRPLIIENNLICKVGAIFVDYDSTHEFVIRANNKPNIDISVNIKPFSLTSKYSGVGIDTCEGAKVHDCYIEVDNGRAVAVVRSPKSEVYYNDIELGYGGNNGIGIQYHGASNVRAKIRHNNIYAADKVSRQTTIGVQPTGEKWGAAGIVLYNGDSIDATGSARYKWETVNGTYTITGAETPPIVIANAAIVSGDDWEAGSATSLDQSTGIWDTLLVQKTLAIDGGISITGLTGSSLNRIGSASDVITWQANSYEHGCRDIEISNNSIDGVIYGGISCFGARDITLIGNNISSCGDIGFDPEGCVRMTYEGGVIKDCGFGALLVGHNSTITGTSFENCRTADIRLKGANSLYQEAPSGYIAPFGIVGNNAIVGAQLHTSVFMTINAEDSDHASNFTINGCSSLIGKNSNRRGIELSGAFNFSISNNGLRSPIYLTDCNRFKVATNQIDDAHDDCIELVGCSDFMVKHNQGSNTTGALGGRDLISYLNCSNGVIKDNDAINLVAGGVLSNDKGGNTSITVIDGDLL